MILILSAVFLTAGQQKYNHNTLSTWPPGQGWTSQEELEGYLWLKTLPVDTKVFTFYHTGKVFGLDKYSCDWCEEVVYFRETVSERTAQEINSWLKTLSYEYLVVSGSTVRQMGFNETNSKLEELSASGLFTLIFNTNDFFAFRIE